MSQADTDLEAFRDYCREAFQFHDQDDPCLQPYRQALAVIEEYQAYLARGSDLEDIGQEDQEEKS